MNKVAFDQGSADCTCTHVYVYEVVDIYLIREVDICTYVRIYPKARLALVLVLLGLDVLVGVLVGTHGGNCAKSYCYQERSIPTRSPGATTTPALLELPPSRHMPPWERVSELTHSTRSVAPTKSFDRPGMDSPIVSLPSR